MTVPERIPSLLGADADPAAERAEDSRAMPDADHERQLDLLAQLRRGIADVSMARRRIEVQGEEIAARFDRLAEQARLAMSRHHEDLARTALERRAVFERALGGLRRQYATIHQQEKRLQADERRIAARTTAFRAGTETPIAGLTASVGGLHADESATGIASDVGVVRRDLVRARDEVLRTQARAAVTDDLIAGGGVPGPTAIDEDLEHRLAAARTGEEIERQLQALRQRGASDSDGPRWMSRSDALATGRDA